MQDGPVVQQRLRILFLGKRFYTNKDALRERFGRIYQLPWHWAGDGHDVRLLLVDYHTRESVRLRDGGLDVHSVPFASGAAPAAVASACFRFRPQLVVASGDCYLGLLAWQVALLSRARFVFDIYDKYDDFPAYRTPPGLDLFAFLRGRAASRFYASRTLRSALADEVDPKSLLVPNGVDATRFVPLDLQACRARLQLPADSQLVGYFGSMEPVRGVRDLVDAVGQLRRRGAKLKLLVCGKDHAEVDLTQDWTIYRGLVPHDEIPHYVNACDVVALPYRQSALLDNSSSCKIAEYIACGRPLVSTRTPNFLENFGAQAGALGEALCAPDDPQDLARAIGWQLREKRTVAANPDWDWAAIARAALRGAMGWAAPRGQTASAS